MRATTEPAAFQRSRETDPGCRPFDVCRDGAEPGRAYFYELCDDAAANLAQPGPAHGQHTNAQTADWVSSKRVRQGARTSP